MEPSSCFCALKTMRYVEKRMNRLLKSGAMGAFFLATVTACTNPYDPGQRAAGGALIGAGSGAAIGAIAGGGRGAALGALIGGGAGALTGYATTPPPPPPQQGYYRQQQPGYDAPPPPPPPPPGY
jgi:hypothetical protein